MNHKLIISVSLFQECNSTLQIGNSEKGYILIANSESLSFQQMRPFIKGGTNFQGQTFH